MANKKKVSAVLVALCVLMCLCLLAACENTQPTDPTTTTSTEPPEVIYTISVKTIGGLALEDVGYYVYASSARDHIVDYGDIDKDGMIIFTAPRSDEYVLYLKNVPLGYDVQEMYALKNTKLDIVLTPSVVTEGNATDRVYKLGDVVTDFSITDTDGNVHTISEILKTKEAVVLNFWYTRCDPCKQEFPYLQRAYELYKDKLEVIAMDPSTDDTEEDVAKYKADKGLTFPMAKVDAAWITAMGIDAYPRTVIIDRYGVVCLTESGKIVEEGVFEGAFNYFTSENYTQKLVTDIHELDTLQYPEGHKRNPMQTNGAVGQFQLTVEMGKEFYCNISRCDDIIFRINNAYISVIYDEDRYEPDENGVIEFQLSCKSTTDYVQVIFCNDTEEDQTVSVILQQPPGTVSTPIEMTYGEMEVLLEQGRNKGMYYTMTADKQGFIHLTLNSVTENVDYEIQIENLNSLLTMLFSMACVEDAEGNYVMVVPVAAGDKLRVAFMSLPDRLGAYPAVAFQTTVSYSEHGGTGTQEEIPYTLTFKDVEGQPMAGITATFTVNGEAVVLVSDETGVITTMLPAGSYMVQLVFPEGFTADASQYLLTPDDTAKEVVVRLYQEKEIEYTIHVQDHDGLPVVGAVVTVGTSYAITDKDGNVVFKLPVGSYVAIIVPPEGYTAKEDKYPFGVRPEMTIILENDQSTTKIPYTVTVLDGYGDPYTDVVVRFYAEDGSVTMAVVSAEGVATATLIQGNYTVELVFKQNNMFYESVGLQLTADVTSTIIVVAPGVSGKPGQIKPTTSSSTFEAYYVQVGNTYVNLTAMDVTYFLFKPTQTGTYKISTNKAGALVENWQSVGQVTPNTAGVENNIYTLEVTELGKTYVIGIEAAYDITNTILTVFRVPDCVVDAFPVTPNLPETPFVPYMPSHAQIKYLDFSGMVPMILGADGYYHLDNEYGPVVMVDLLNERYGISILKLLSSGEMAWYKYDEDGYPIYKRDYTASMNAYLAIMEPTKGLYPLTQDLYTIIKQYGDHAGWWDSESETYLFDSLKDNLLIEDSAWMFLCCYIYINPDQCEHSFGQWTLTPDGSTMIRHCPHCQKIEAHILNQDCGVGTAGEWVLSEDTLYYTTTCTICGQAMKHVVGTDCDDASCNQWTLSEDGTYYERSCSICGSIHKHMVGADCREEHFGQWTLSADETGYERTCAICGAVQKHIIGTDCRNEHFGQWALSADETGYERTCTICGAVQKHITGTDCQDEHFGQWAPSADEAGYERSCTICGAVQKHAPGTDCRDKHFGQWTLSADETAYERSCTICGTMQRHIIGTDCRDVTFGQWALSTDSSCYERTCTVCATVQKHVIGTDCDTHYSAWTKSEDGQTFTRTCTICGNTQTHNVGTDCESHYSAWTNSEDGLTATRTCDICGNQQTHTCGADCEGHYGEWTACADGVNQERTCAICGNKQTQAIPTVPDQSVTPTPSDPEEQDPAEG